MPRHKPACTKCRTLAFFDDGTYDDGTYDDRTYDDRNMPTGVPDPECANWNTLTG
jgi:hypothetical protein